MKSIFGMVFLLTGMAFCSTAAQGKIKELQVYSMVNPEKANACTAGNVYVLLDNGTTFWHAAGGGEGGNNPILNMLFEAYSTNQTIKLEVEDAGNNCSPSNFKKIISIKMIRL